MTNVTYGFNVTRFITPNHLLRRLRSYTVMTNPDPIQEAIEYLKSNRDPMSLGEAQEWATAIEQLQKIAKDLDYKLGEALSKIEAYEYAIKHQPPVNVYAPTEEQLRRIKFHDEVAKNTAAYRGKSEDKVEKP